MPEMKDTSVPTQQEWEIGCVDSRSSADHAGTHPQVISHGATRGKIHSPKTETVDVHRRSQKELAPLTFYDLSD